MNSYLYSIADTVNNLGDCDFYNVMMEIAKMRGFCDSIEEFTEWLAEFLNYVQLRYTEWL